MGIAEMDQLVERIVARVRERLLVGDVPSIPVVTGIWQDEHALRLAMVHGADRLGTAAGSDAPFGEVPRDVARLIDHTLLKATATRQDIEKLCEEAKKYHFASVCLNTTWMTLAASLLEGTDTKPICVVGFPLGAMSTAAKAAETRDAIANGAAEIDMVINIGELKGASYDRVLQDIREVVAAAQGRPVKVILETSLLSREEKIAGSALARAAGAAFVKTSTGFAGGGATVEDVALIRTVVGPDMGIKASGGVKSAEDVKNLVAAGATRIGASASVAIVTGRAGEGKY
jgi:deoxyribose-phosphate aldolase